MVAVFKGQLIIWQGKRYHFLRCGRINLSPLLPTRVLELKIRNTGKDPVSKGTGLCIVTQLTARTSLSFVDKGG